MLGPLVALGAAIAALAFPGFALGTAGDLDPSFSGDGIATTPASPVGVGAVAVDSRGRIVVASIDDVVRYMPNGTPDKSFSGDGRVKSPFAGDLNSLAIDSQDRIVVVGAVPNPVDPSGRDAFAVARLRPNGTLDPSFSGDGMTLTPIGDAGADYAFDVVIDGQGRIVVTGPSDRQDGGSAFALARYLPNGEPDTSFSGNGQLQTELPNVKYSDPFAVALDSEGRIVVAGSGDNQFAVARYTPSGRLDPSFSGDGTETTSVGPSGSETHGYAMTVDHLNRIVVVGDEGGITRRMALVRYRPNGSLDTSFSDDGKVLTRFNRDRNLGYGVTIDHHNRIAAVASIYDLTPERRPAFGVARYKSDGTLDPSFSQDGRVITFIGQECHPGAVTVDAHDKIVAAGYSKMGSSGSLRIAVARYLGG